MKVVFSAELYVATYNISIDGGADIPFTPNSDGTGTYDMGPLNLAPGAHTVKADAVNPSGTSGYCADVPFTEPVPAPAVPQITVTS